jgi:hypothetical protein
MTGVAVLFTCPTCGKTEVATASERPNCKGQGGLNHPRVSMRPHPNAGRAIHPDELISRL